MQPGAAANKSRTWFNQQVALLANVSSSNIKRQQLNDSNNALATKVKLGSMYYFKYMPKNAATMRFYDTFPLIFPFNADRTTFSALNFHYLSPYMRAKLLDNIMEFSNDKRLTEDTKAKFSWQAINAVAQHRLTQQTVKKYLYTHVQSQIKIVNPEYWVSTIMLPTESFVGSSKYGVWA